MEKTTEYTRYLFHPMPPKRRPHRKIQRYGKYKNDIDQNRARLQALWNYQDRTGVKTKHKRYN